MRSSGHERTLAVYGALAANMGIAVTKFIVAAVTGSSALLAEGIHSTVDTANELLLLVGLRRSRRPATKKHPFGHGKELYFWGLIVAMVIFAGGGAVSIAEGATRIAHGELSGGERLSWKLGILGIALVFESLSLRTALRAVHRRDGESVWRALRRMADPAVYTVVAEDCAAVGGIFLAGLGVTLAHVLDAPWIDAATSIAIGALLCVVAVGLSIQSRTLLIGQSADTKLVTSIRDITRGVDNVAEVGEPLTMRLGPHDVLVNVDVVLEAGTSLERMGAALGEIEAAIRKAHENVGRVFVEMHVAHSSSFGEAPAAHDR